MIQNRQRSEDGPYRTMVRSHHHILVDARKEPITRIDAEARLREVDRLNDWRVRGLRFFFRLTGRRMVFVVFETIQILVPFPTLIALVGFELLHAFCPRIRVHGFWIDD